MIQQGRLDEALTEASQANRIITNHAHGTQYHRALSSNALGFVHLATEDWQSAIDYFDAGTAALVSIRGNYSPDLPPGYIGFSKAYRETGQYRESVAYVQKALHVIERSGAVGSIRLGDALVSWAETEADRGSCSSATQKSLEALESILTGSDSFVSMSKERSYVSAKSERDVVSRVLAVISHCRSRGNTPLDIARLLMLSLQVPQLNATSLAVEKLNLRSLTTSEQLRALVKDSQNMIERMRSLSGKIAT